MTLIELAVVLAVTAILAGITLVAVRGSGATARGTTKVTDTREVQKAVNVYHGLHPQDKWPTSGKQIAGHAILSGDLPKLPFAVSNPASFVAIDWSATFTTSLDGPRSLVPQFLRRMPKHATLTTVDADGDGVTDQPAPTPAWVLDSNGLVYVLIEDGAY